MTSGSTLSKEIRSVLKENPSLEYDETLNKIKCSLSGHEMPCSINQIQTYIKGKKFKKFKDRQENAFEKYKPHVVPNTKEGHSHQLFCLLTRRKINKSIEHVERHVNGVKYKKALAKWEASKDDENNTEVDNNTSEKEECLIEEEGEEEEQEENEEQDDLDDLYPDVDDDSEEENKSHNNKPANNKPSTSKRKSESKDSGPGKKRKRQKKKKPK